MKELSDKDVKRESNKNGKGKFLNVWNIPLSWDLHHKKKPAHENILYYIKNKGGIYIKSRVKLKVI